MNVVLVILGAQVKSEATKFWKRRLIDPDHLSVLTCGGTNLSRIPEDHMHELEEILFFTESRRWPKKFLEVSFNNLRRVRTLFPKLSYPYSLLLWSAVVRCRWDDLIWDLRSIDPDVIDLRWMPRSIALSAKLREKLPWVMMLSDKEEVVRHAVDDSWRKYDPRLRVSIVLPVYNGAKYLRQSIESCLKQTHRSIELIIVDDCSTDSTPEIIAEYAGRDSRIVSMRNRLNLRLPGALNVGFRSATGQLMSWTSHDNYYAPNAIELLVRQLCSLPQIGLVYSSFHHIDALGRVDPRIVYLPPPGVLLYHVNAVGPCFLYRRTVSEEIGDYDERIEFEEDYEYWLRVFRRFKMMRLHLPLYYYRRHAESMTARRHRAQRGEVVGRQK